MQYRRLPPAVCPDAPEGYLLRTHDCDPMPMCHQTYSREAQQPGMSVLE
jgi:hypothetical protein